jgi:hypothetical protein
MLQNKQIASDYKFPGRLAIRHAGLSTDHPLSKYAPTGAGVSLRPRSPETTARDGVEPSPGVPGHRYTRFSCCLSGGWADQTSRHPAIGSTSPQRCDRPLGFRSPSRS